MHLISSKAVRIALDERCPRIAWYESPDGKTRIPGERDAVAPRLYIFRTKDRAQLTTDDDGVRAAYELRAFAAEAVYRAKVTCDGVGAVEFDVSISLKGADAMIRVENVREGPGHRLLSVRFQRVVAASSRDEDGRLATCGWQGRLLDPRKCKPNMTDYSWHGTVCRQCGAAYRSRFMVTFDAPGYEDLFIQEVRQYSRIGCAETLASLGSEIMYRQRDIEGPKNIQIMPPARKCPPILRMGEPLKCMGPKGIRLHFIRARKGRSLDWTDAARYFQTLLPAGIRPEPRYDNTLVYKSLLALRDKPTMTIGENLEWVRKIHHLTDGMKQVCYVTGFQHRGHDSGWPDVFTTYDAVADKPSIRLAIVEAREKYNTRLSFHLNMDVFSDTCPNFEGRYVTRDVQGRISGQGNWDGNELWGLCVPAYLKQLGRIVDRVVKEYGVRDTIHLDTFNGAPYVYDASPLHPYSAYEFQQGKMKLVKEFARHGIDMTSECMTDPYVGKIGHAWSLFNYGHVWDGEERIPFTNFIYHGFASWNSGHGAIPLAWFGDQPGIEDTVLGWLLNGGGAGIELNGRKPGQPGHDHHLPDLLDLLYLVQPPYMMLRNRKWTGFRTEGSVRRVEYGPGSYIEIDPEGPTYQVVVDGRMAAKDFCTVFAGPRKGTYLAYSRTDRELDWPAPQGWRKGAVSAVVLTEGGPGVRLPARVEKGRLRLTLRAHEPVRLGPMSK